jgi:hypothetical protein
MELNVSSDDVVVEVSRDGSAIVSHEMLIRLRGSPLDQWSIEGVDADAEPLPDATMTLARSGKEAGLPMPLQLSNAGGRMNVKVLYKDGVRRGGSYIARFRYKTNLAEGNRIHAGRSFTELRWQGPELSNGVDSMRVVFRVPKAGRAPELPKSDEAQQGVGIAEEIDGVFLSTLRRGDVWDEIDIVRPHVAKRERVVWRTRVDPSAFDVKQASAAAASAEARPLKPLRSVVHSPARPRAFPYWVALAAASFYALLLGLKARAMKKGAAGAATGPRGLLLLPTWMRVLSASGAFAGAAYVALDTEYPSVAGCLLVAAILCACHRAPRVRPALRGPGTWMRIAPEDAFRVRAAPRLPGRFFDAGSPLGFALFFLLLLGFVAAALVVLRTSAYEAVAVLLGASSLFPIFCTGRAAELPHHPVDEARRLLGPMYSRLASNRTLSVSPLARVSEGRSEPDELRLSVMPRHPLRGVESIEVGHDHERGAAGILPMPYVIVRIADGSEAAETLPKGLLWTRGRSADERVAVIRPRLPTRGAVMALVQRLARALSKAPQRRTGVQRASSARSSSGRGASTAKPGTTSSPAQAT